VAGDVIVRATFIIDVAGDVIVRATFIIDVAGDDIVRATFIIDVAGDDIVRATFIIDVASDVIVRATFIIDVAGITILVATVVIVRAGNIIPPENDSGRQSLMEKLDRKRERDATCIAPRSFYGPRSGTLDVPTASSPRGRRRWPGPEHSGPG
jgi:hypothetical protein